MPFATRERVSALALEVLCEVADFAAEDKSFDFSKFTRYHIFISINQIATLLSSKGLRNRCWTEFPLMGAFPKDMTDVFGASNPGYAAIPSCELLHHHLFSHLAELLTSDYV